MDRIAEIRERLEKATPGPWKHIEGTIYGASKTAFDPMICELYQPNDKELIVNAPDDIAFLLGEIERLQKENEYLQTAREACRKSYYTAMQEIERLKQVIKSHAPRRTELHKTKVAHRALERSDTNAEVSQETCDR